MKSIIRLSIVTILILVFFAGFWVIYPSMIHGSFSVWTAAESSDDTKREEAYRANNLGVALLEQFNHTEAVEAFRRALEIDPGVSIARINLAIALFNAAQIEESKKEALTAVIAAPDYPQPHYTLGLIARLQNRNEDALAAFRRVLSADPKDVGTIVNIGQIYIEERKYEQALSMLRQAVETEPYNATATYLLATALLRSDSRDEGKQMLDRFQALRKSGAATTIGQNYLEQGRYAEAITSTGAEQDLVDKKTPDVAFTDTTTAVFGDLETPSKVKDIKRDVFGRSYVPGAPDSKAKTDIPLALSGGTALFDFDADGDLDMAALDAESQSLYRNDGGKFIDVTKQSGGWAETVEGIGTGVIVGDFDNDEKPDLFVLRYGKSSLYRNEGNGRFSDITASAKIPNYSYLSISAAFVDIEHDGDLDIFIAGLADLEKPAKKDAVAIFPDGFAGAPNMLLRNNGDGTFVDITEAAGVAGVAADNHAVAVVPFDYDNRRDVDLLVVNYSKEPALFRNLRDGTFKDVAEKVGLTKDARGLAVAAGDINKDEFTDFFFGNGTFAITDGKGKYNLSKLLPGKNKVFSAAQILDYDNDGLLDLVTISQSGISVFRNLGNTWNDVTGETVSSSLRSTDPKEFLGIRGFAAGDIDVDGDNDLLLRGHKSKFVFASNNAGKLRRSVRVLLEGKVSNRSGIGAKIEIRAGSLIQKFETYSATPAPAPADVLLGLGNRPTVDAVRVLWPAGIVQAETQSIQEKDISAAVKITELDRKPSSCPYLYTWNGKDFEFVTDFMGGGELGYWLAPGVRAKPDPDEYVRIRGDQLKERNGRFEIRVTNELEEALFMDHLKLLAVTHPAGTEIYPNEGLGNPTSKSFKLYTSRNARPPVSVIDHDGSDVLEQTSSMDRRYPTGFKLSHIRGYSEEHSLTLDLGNTSGKSPLLLMTGWTDYAFSSDNVAASQSGLALRPPSLQVKDRSGNWQTVMDNIGFPVGRPQTVTVDLTNKFLSSSREVRIVTNMRIYWDQILVDSSTENFDSLIEVLETNVADLGWRGFSAEETPDGREPFGYDYERVSSVSPWKTFPGRYTREGDVRELLGKVDDIFVISLPGDEISVSFDAARLRPLKKGSARTYLLYVDGFSKEMDINSGSPDQVFPLPFHGMTDYPYQLPEVFPMTESHRVYAERYNKRVVNSSIMPIEAILKRLNSESAVSSQ